MIEVSRAHMALSDVYLKDALGEAQSQRGRVDCAFEAGYAALLSVLSPPERDVPEHPSENAASLAAQRLGIDASQVAQLVRNRYSADEPPGLADALAWAETVRTRVGEVTAFLT
jgi:hypothetical protein